MISVAQPGSWPELSEVVSRSDRILIGDGIQFRNTPERTWLEQEGAWSEDEWTPNVEGIVAAKANRFTHLDFSKLPELFELDTQNQTLTISAHSELYPALSKLRDTEFSVPYMCAPDCSNWESIAEIDSIGFSSIGDAIAANWPHVRQSQHGSWRDWVIGAKIMLPDGSIVKSGSTVVKSVSGFDLHKLMIGSRHTLGILLELCLKVIPRKSVALPEIEVRTDLKPRFRIYPQFGRRLNCIKIPGVSAEQFGTQFGIYPWIHDTRAGTFWFESGPVGDLPVGLVTDLRTNYWDAEPEIHSPQTQALMRRTKQIFDPTNKLNPGEFGFL